MPRRVGCESDKGQAEYETSHWCAAVSTWVISGAKLHNVQKFSLAPHPLCSLKKSRVCARMRFSVSAHTNTSLCYFQRAQINPLKTDIFTPSLYGALSHICFNVFLGDLRRAEACRNIQSLCPHLSMNPSSPSAEVQTLTCSIWSGSSVFTHTTQ